MEVPAFTFSTGSPTVNFGQITKLYITDVGNPLSALTSTELETRIDNGDTMTAGAIRELTVIASKPAPERDSVDISGFRKVRSAPKHTINIKIDETDTVNYDAVKSLVDGVSTVLVWFQTRNHFYGGVAGIEASIDLNHIIPESGDELETIEGTLEWEGDYPQRDSLPLPSA